MSEWLNKKNTLFIIAFAVILVVAAILTLMLNGKQNTVPLFDRLTEKETGQVANTLEQLKVEYRLGEQGAVLVDKEKLQDIKVKLASSGFELNPQEGFELFDTVDYGLNEFSQNILLQRALQGELAKTISLANEVASARVHIVLGERGVFRQKETAKAAVTLILEPGKTLTKQQVNGVQKLVASAVDGLAEKDVTVSDSSSTVLSATDDDFPSVSQVIRKQEIEAYFVSKASALLSDIYGEGNFSVTVDVDLDLTERQSEIEELLPSSNNKNVGFLVKDKSSGLQNPGDNRGSSGQGSSDLDINIDRTFEFGKRRERVTQNAGQIKRITVSVVIPSDGNDDQSKNIKSLVSAAIGASEDRKDRIEVFAMRLGPDIEASKVLQEPHTLRDEVKIAQNSPSNTGSMLLSQPPKVTSDFSESKNYTYSLVALAILLTFLIIITLHIVRVRSSSSLTQQEREKLLLDIRQWLAD